MVSRNELTPSGFLESPSGLLAINPEGGGIASEANAFW